MKILIKTLAELQQYLKVDSTFIPASLYPFQVDAIARFLRDILDQDLTDALLDWYNVETPDAEQTDFIALLPFVQRVIAKFSFFLGAPNLDLKLTDAGFGVVSNQTLAPASKDRVNRFVAALEADGWDAVESLIRFLEMNAIDYPLWTESDAYTMAMRNFINSAEEFDRFVDIGKNRLKFARLRNRMDDVEILRIEPVISKPLADLIKLQLRTDALTEDNAVLLAVIRRALANLVAGEELNPKFSATGEQYLSQVRRVLDKNPQAYPLYAESIYVADKSYQNFENTEDLTFFVAGS